MIYVEGGGDHIHQRRELRLGFDALLGSVKMKTRDKRMSLKITCCGGRQEAYDDFMNALAKNAERINVLLVDSEEGLVEESGDLVRDGQARVDHLVKRDGWKFAAVRSECVHLMVRTMETWIVADADALEEFYGKGFVIAALPKRGNLEDETKSDISAKLKKATEKTQKSSYHKIGHASLLLQKIDPQKVAERCPRFRTFLSTLEKMIA
jgi:hypothetical protein